MSGVFRSSSRFSRTSGTVAALSAFLVSLAGLPVRAADGPGAPNEEYTLDRVGERLSLIDPGKAVSALVMHRGYMFVPLSEDHGGGMGDGAFAFYDVSKPEHPLSIFDSRQMPERYHTAGTNDYVGDFAEMHHLSASDDLFLISERRPGSAGFVIFDTAPLYDNDGSTQPRIVSRFSYPGVTSSTDYDGYSFAPAWQGKRYVYAPTGAQGLYIIDTTDLAHPVQLNHLSRSAMGNLTLRGSWIIGNLLILSEVDQQTTFKARTYDVSDPSNPVQIGSFGGFFGYHAFVYGAGFYNAATPIMRYDFTNPAGVVGKQLATYPFDRPEYGFGKDDHIFIGHEPGGTKWKLNGNSATFVSAVNSGIIDDHGFLNPVGNLLACCSDHNNPMRIILGIHGPEKDVIPPRPLFTSPADGAINQNILSRVGISFSDYIDPNSVNAGTLEVRNLGTGAKVAGTYSTMAGIVNFAPDAPLSPGATYDVVLLAGGVKDPVGNAIPVESRVIRFTTGSQLTDYRVTIPTAQPVQEGGSATLTLALTNPNNLSLEHSWDFGDGSPSTAFSPATSTTHAYAKAGNYSLTVRTRIAGQTYAPSVSGVQVVHRSIPAVAPSIQSNILCDPGGFVWTVNPDNDSVSALDPVALAKVYEVPVGRHPVAIATGPDGLLWVLNQESSNLTAINRSTGAVAKTVPLPANSSPRGLAVDAASNLLYVTLEARNLLVKLSGSTGQVLDTLPIGPNCRALSLDPVRSRLWISRFISPDSGGEVVPVDLATFSVGPVVGLAPVTAPDSLQNGRGIPNYLQAVSLSPDYTQAYVPAKKDNIFRGTRRDGEPLTFEHTVRSMASCINLVTNQEVPAKVLDFDNSDFATAAAWSPLGNMVFFATSGSATIWAVDAYNPASSYSFSSGGIAPDGIAIDGDGSQIFVHNFMDRSVTVFLSSAACGGVCGTAPQVAKISTVTTEALPAAVLRGKKIFYNSNDPKLAQEGYMSCASCHLDGGHDGRVWDFTNLGEGFRNTIDLNGHGVGHGPAHWSGNFDETQDFEGQIRQLAHGSGFLSDASFATGTLSVPLGAAKAGMSADLDALAAYIGSLTQAGKSPWRNDDGTLSADALAGREIFRQENCAKCHSGTAFTDSASLVRHDVGTLTANSGERLGIPLDGLDTPTLRGLWKSAPYLHDGSAATLAQVFTSRDLSGRHAALFQRSSAEIAQLAAYLNSIDDLEFTAPTPAVGSAPSLTAVSDRNSLINQYLQASFTATGSGPLTWSGISLPPGLEIDPVTGVVSGSPSRIGVYPVQIAVRDASGRSASIRFSWEITATIAYRYVKFSVLQSQSGLYLTCIAEFNLLDEFGQRLDRSHWSLTASTEEFVGEPGAVHRAIDDVPATYWQSGYASPPFPHEMTVDMGGVWAFSGFSLLPRPSNTSSRIKDYRLYGSNDGTHWTQIGPDRSFENNEDLKTVMFTDNINHPPVLASPPAALNVTENSPLGTIVATISATDPNAGQQITYSLGAGNLDGAFAIDPATGVIRVAGSIDYERLPIYHLQVIATDNASPALSASLTLPVTVNNVVENNREAVLITLTSATGPFAGQGNPALIDFTADPDQDGLSNALEVLLGTDPTRANAQPPMRPVEVIEGGETYMAWEYRTAAIGGLTCTLLGSDDMIHWTTLSRTPVQVATANGLTTWRIREDQPLKIAKRRFVRLSAE